MLSQYTTANVCDECPPLKSCWGSSRSKEIFRLDFPVKRLLARSWFGTGCVKSLAENSFLSADGNFEFRAWDEAIVVRAVSKTDPPAWGSLEPCGGDALSPWLLSIIKLCLFVTALLASSFLPCPNLSFLLHLLATSLALLLFSFSALVTSHASPACF